MSKQLIHKDYPPGAVIFREGDHGDCAFIVESGEIEIVKGEGATARRLGTLGPGSIFGEMALVDNQPRMASAIALKHSTAIVVPGATFRTKLAKTDPFIAALVRLLNGSVRQLQDEITRLRLAAPEGRNPRPL